MGPARLLGHELVAVAVRDRARAEAFAAERGIPRVQESYADVIADPDVDLVYNALVNSLHAQLARFADSLKSGAPCPGDVDAARRQRGADRRVLPPGRALSTQ